MTFQKSLAECLLSSKAVIQIGEYRAKLGSAFGHKRTFLYEVVVLYPELAD